MWLCCNNGLVSVVADRDHADQLLVRARRKSDLVNILGNDAAIFEDPIADYRWRCFVGREAFKALIGQRVDDIDYPNFKNSVADRDLHELYAKFWNLHHKYQTEDPSGKAGHRRRDFSWKPEDPEKL